MEVYQIKETVLQHNTYPKYLEKVMGGRHRWGHLYSGFQGICPARGGTHGCGQLAWKKARKKCAGKTEVYKGAGTQGKTPWDQHWEHPQKYEFSSA